MAFDGLRVPDASPVGVEPGGPAGPPASARSIFHGVWPPLMATMKRPRAATAARASAEVNAAPARATESASASASILMTS